MRRYHILKKQGISDKYGKERLKGGGENYFDSYLSLASHSVTQMMPSGNFRV